MTNPAKRKGDKAELEVANIIHDLTGFPARRKLGAGRQDDTGDIAGVPHTTIQVAAYADLTRAVREKVPACVVQQRNAGTLFGATFVKRKGGGYLVMLTPDQWATYMRESLPL